MTRGSLLCAAAALTLTGAAGAQGGAAGKLDRPVRIGGDADLDACTALAKVVKLDPRGDNFLAVKAGPSLRATRIDRLGPGALVHSCDEAAGGWIGVVYAPAGAPSDGCGVSSPVRNRRAYAGSCRSGWISAEYLEVIAG